MQKRLIRVLGFTATLLWLLGWIIPAGSAGESPVKHTGYGPGLHGFGLEIAGRERTFATYVPSTYNPDIPLPVVIMLHGGGGSARSAMGMTGWVDKAEREGFLAAFPNASPPDPSRPGQFRKNPQLWNDGSGRFHTESDAPDDVAFIGRMLDDLCTRFTIDPRRIFVSGFSNGASMCFLLGARLSDRIAAIAPVAGACWITPDVLSRPVPMIYITGTSDPLNPINGGVPKFLTGGGGGPRAKPKPPVQESILKWLRALNLAATPSRITETGGVRFETYDAASGGTGVVAIFVKDLGHNWAGGRNFLPEHLVGATSEKINTTDVIWDFFLRSAAGIRFPE